MQFAVEAMRPDGTLVQEALEAGDRHAAEETLRERGLILLRLDEAAGGAAEGGGLSAVLQFLTGHVTLRDCILFTRQMKMLLEAGSPLVPALDAAQQQTSKPFMRALLGRLKTAVEEGDSLTEALETEKAHFDPVFRSMVAAGEATASLADVFGRLCQLAQSQLRTRKLITAALTYPAVLCVLLIGVISILLFFVVPRFNTLFTSLGSTLPATTEMLFNLSGFLMVYWPHVLGALLAGVIGLVVLARLPGTRARLDEIMLGLPVVGRVASRLILARVLRVWAAMLRCHVPLLDAIHKSRSAVGNAAFMELIEQVEEAVSSGRRMGEALSNARLADPIIVSAVRTGEENGRLAEAIDFVSNWLEEDNTSVIQNVTRMAEPALLAVMGVVVGIVAMGLFLPLFEMATAA